VTVFGADYRICGPLAHYAVALTFLHAVDTVITLLLPFIIISVLNQRIAITVVRNNRARRTMLRISIQGRMMETVVVARRRSRATVATDGDVPGSSLRQQPQQQQQVPRLTARDVHSSRRLLVGGVIASGGSAQFRVTKLLLTVSAVFLFLNLPRHVVRTYSFVIDLVHPYQPPTPVFLAYIKLFQIVYYLQFAVNPILYATIGRSSFIGSLRRIAHRSRRRFTNAIIFAQLSFAAVRWFTVFGRRLPSTDTELTDEGNSRRQLGAAFSSLDEHEMVVLTASRETPIVEFGAVQPDAESHLSLE